MQYTQIVNKAPCEQVIYYSQRQPDWYEWVLGQLGRLFYTEYAIAKKIHINNNSRNACLLIIIIENYATALHNNEQPNWTTTWMCYKVKWVL